MKNSAAVLSVKFSSTFSQEKLSKVCEGDLEIFRSVPGLLQKYYIAEETTGAISGFYVFDSSKARSDFWESDLAKSIPERYGVIPASLRVEQYGLMIILNDVLVAG